jgi:hypothetical protein
MAAIIGSHCASKSRSRNDSKRASWQCNHCVRITEFDSHRLRCEFHYINNAPLMQTYARISKINTTAFRPQAVSKDRTQ